MITFSKKISENYNIRELDIDQNNSYLLNHLWPGNVRELRNMIERIAILQPDTKDKVSNIIKESIKADSLSEKIKENSLKKYLKIKKIKSLSSKKKLILEIGIGMGENLIHLSKLMVIYLISKHDQKVL